MMILSDEASPPCKLTLQDDAPKGVLGNLPDRIDQLTSPFDITLELQVLMEGNYSGNAICSNAAAGYVGNADPFIDASI